MKMKKAHKDIKVSFLYVHFDRWHLNIKISFFFAVQNVKEKESKIRWSLKNDGDGGGGGGDEGSQRMKWS